MVNGNNIKAEVKYELEHINNVNFEIKNGSIEITSLAIDEIYDSILFDTEHIQYKFESAVSHREYFVENNILKIRVKYDRTITLYNLEQVMKEAITETYYDLCNYARTHDVFIEPDDSILL